MWLKQKQNLMKWPLDDDFSRLPVIILLTLLSEWVTYMTSSHKRGLKSLVPIRAAGEDVKGNHHAPPPRLTPALQRTDTLLSFEILDWFHIKLHSFVVYFVTMSIYVNNDNMDLRPLYWERVTWTMRACVCVQPCRIAGDQCRTLDDCCLSSELCLAGECT